MAEGEEVKETTSTGSAQDMTLYYVLGGVVLVAVIAAGYFLMPKSTPAPTPEAVVQQIPPQPSPTPGPITKLACDYQYYNPVVGFPKYYLSVEGGDIKPATKVTCSFTVSVGDKVEGTDKITSPLTDSPQRGGSTFRCSTKAMELTPQVVTKIDVVLKDDNDKTATCGGTFLLPKS